MKHVEVAAAIIISRGRVLCARRGGHTYSYLAYKFEFPGGKMEPGEDARAAVVREIREELGIVVTVLREYMSVDYSYPDFSITLHTCLCRTDTDSILSKEHTECLWVLPADLSALDWAAADRPVVQSLERDLKRGNAFQNQ